MWRQKREKDSYPGKVAATLFFGLIFSMALVEVGCQPYQCPDIKAETCTSCDINGDCMSCIPAYYLSDGYCLRCKPGCTSCVNEASNCSTCAEGFYLEEATCSPCENTCLVCQGSADNCLECQSDYKLDSRNNCHYRYTLILILVCSLFVTVFVCGILVAVRGCCTQAHAKPENYGSVLDDEIRKHAATVVSCVQEIGKTEDENDISVVESDMKPKKNQKQSFLDPLNDSVDTKMILSNLDEGVSVSSDVVPNPKFTVRGGKNR